MNQQMPAPSPILSEQQYRACRLCPRECGVDRTVRTGYCGCYARVKAARAALHLWEEPCISGEAGSGAVFFSGCTLGCCFCQNYPISHENFGKEITDEELADIFLRLQDQGALNLNLITATQFLPSIVRALDLVRGRLSIPVVYNCGGYERPEIIRALKDYVDIWLPDLKYFDSSLSRRYSQAENYFSCASEAIRQMVAQAGPPVFDSRGVLQSGVIIRHLVLPGARRDSIRLLHWMKENLPEGGYLLSLLSQYTPAGKAIRPAQASAPGHSSTSGVGARPVSAPAQASAPGHSSTSGVGARPSAPAQTSAPAKENAHQSGQPAACLYPELTRRITTYEYESVLNAALDLGLDTGYMQQKSSAKEEYTPPFHLEGL